MLNLACQQLKDGMILMQDLRIKDGRLLLIKGTMLNRQSVQSIHGIAARNLIEDDMCSLACQPAQQWLMVC